MGTPSYQVNHQYYLFAKAMPTVESTVLTSAIFQTFPEFNPSFKKCSWYRPLGSLHSVDNFFFKRKIFNSVVSVFFFFFKLPMTRRVQICRVDVLYITSVACYRSLEAGGGSFESRYRPYFLRFLRYSLTRSQLLTSKIKIRVFFDKISAFFCKWAFFPQKLPLFRRDWNKWIFFQCIFDFDKKVSIFLKKPEQSI